MTFRYQPHGLQPEKQSQHFGGEFAPPYEESYDEFDVEQAIAEADSITHINSRPSKKRKAGGVAALLTQAQADLLHGVSDSSPEASTSRVAPARQHNKSKPGQTATKRKPLDLDEDVYEQTTAWVDDYNVNERAKHDVAYVSYGTASASVAFDEAELERKTKEIDSINEDIGKLAAIRDVLIQERNQLLAAKAKSRAASSITVGKEATHRQQNVVNYFESRHFKWKQKLDATLASVFGISKLRLCQEGVLNAVLDNRDVICIMPTGGGKSVCFQAPAVLSHGCTLVISPLISLMSDQVMHLKEKGIEAVMITGSTDKREVQDIMRRLQSSSGSSAEKSIKLCYVTPEKMAKSKQFTSVLSKMKDAGLLTRIAIDESHCCSQLGHDFRPDYKKLSSLRKLFPEVPIIALTATCGKAVLNDVEHILGLKSNTPGEAAEPGRTVFFSAPLYRKNLHYSVRPKPSSPAAVIKEMVEEILENHAHDTGIIYCLSQKDTITIAEGIYTASEGRIRTGTYHASMGDHEKQRIHEKWRNGKVKCVVATIAFGLGIDAPDVRYVFHHCMSKSMEGYYQESGRAGRDGNDSDCVLWFRPADASRLSTLTMEEVGGHQKLYTMLDYALDYKTCRKLLFDNYFGNPASVVAPYAASDRDLCGHCDNCLRNAEGPGTHQGQSRFSAPVSSRNVTVEAWKICKIMDAMSRLHGRVTMPQACDLVRGLGRGAFGTRDKDGKPGGKSSIDLNEICGGKVTLNKDDTEILLLKLLMQGFLQELFYATAYTTISYLVTGKFSARLTRLKESQLNDSGLSIEIDTLSPVKSGRNSRKESHSANVDTDEDDLNLDDGKASKAKKPRSMKTAPRGVTRKVGPKREESRIEDEGNSSDTYENGAILPRQDKEARDKFGNAPKSDYRPEPDIHTYDLDSSLPSLSNFKEKTMSDDDEETLARQPNDIDRDDEDEGEGEDENEDEKGGWEEVKWGRARLGLDSKNKPLAMTRRQEVSQSTSGFVIDITSDDEEDL